MMDHRLVGECRNQFDLMSHELRTPLNAIIGLTDMLVTNAARFGTEKAQEPLQRVNRAGTRHRERAAVRRNPRQEPAAPAGPIAFERENDLRDAARHTFYTERVLKSRDAVSKHCEASSAQFRFSKALSHFAFSFSRHRFIRSRPVIARGPIGGRPRFSFSGTTTTGPALEGRPRGGRR